MELPLLVSHLCSPFIILLFAFQLSAPASICLRNPQTSKAHFACKYGRQEVIGREHSPPPAVLKQRMRLPPSTKLVDGWVLHSGSQSSQLEVSSMRSRFPHLILSLASLFPWLPLPLLNLISWNHLPNKLTAFTFLSQGLLPIQPKSRK